MQGKLKLESRKGFGSRFWFSIPLVEVTGMKQTEVLAEKGLPGMQRERSSCPAKILLAEDNLINTSLAVSLLEMAGYEVTAVANGREAVHHFREGYYDCILMDVQMPDIDGYRAVREIREFEDEHGGRIPIIAMTACAMEGDREKCLEAGMDDYLPKPIDQKVLFKLLCYYLSGRTDQPDPSLSSNS